MAALCYATDCVAEGDVEALHKLGLELEEVALLRDLTLDELRRARALGAHCLDIRLDRNVFPVVIEHLKASRQDEDLQRALIQADAPKEMMRCLFGMGRREYQRLRHLLRVNSGVGRPPELDEATEQALWRALVGRLRPDPDRPLDPEHFLAVQAESGASLRAIWNQALRLARQDQPAPDRR